MVIINFLAAARTGRARDLGEQENWWEAFQKTDTYANLALVLSISWFLDFLDFTLFIKNRQIGSLTKPEEKIIYKSNFQMICYFKWTS